MLNIKKFTFNPFQENTYCLYNDHKAVVIDPGMSNKQEEDKFQDFLKQHKLSLEAIWLTHAHIDHVMGMAFMQQSFNVPVYMHSLEEQNLNSAQMVADNYGIPFQPFDTFEYNDLSKMKEIYLGNIAISILQTPGHSAGSVSFYLSSQDIVVSGDVLFLQSIGRTDLPGGNMNILEKSIKDIMYQLPEQTIIYSGHGAETSIGYEKVNNGFFRA